MLRHLVPEPPVELDPTVVVAGGTDTPHQREYEPRLDQLGNLLNGLGPYRPLALQARGVRGMTMQSVWQLGDQCSLLLLFLVG